MKHKHLIIYILASLTLVLGVGTVLLLRYGNPQSHKYIYIFQCYYWPSHEFGLIKPPDNFSGEYRCWYRNGQLMMLGRVVNGKVTGFYKFWYLNGQLGASGNLKNGKPLNNINFWDQSGKKISRILFGEKFNKILKSNTNP